MAYINLKNNTKVYQSGDTTIYANKDITFSVDKGELVIILAHQAPANLLCLIF